ncbi:MAG: hypothetical protein R2792_08925 [Saprospiraceae bacterium]
MASEKDNKKKDNEPEVSKEKLPDLDIHVNELGEVVKDFDMDELNKFLDRTVDDKKLK